MSWKPLEWMHKAGPEMQMLSQQGTSAAVLTVLIKKVATVKELLRMHRIQERHLNHVHLSVCWMLLCRLLRQALDE